MKETFGDYFDLRFIQMKWFIILILFSRSIACKVTFAWMEHFAPFNFGWLAELFCVNFRACSRSRSRLTSLIGGTVM